MWVCFHPSESAKFDLLKSINCLIFVGDNNSIELLGIKFITINALSTNMKSKLQFIEYICKKKEQIN